MSKALTTTISSGVALSDAIDLRRWKTAVIHMPAGWDAASIGFQVSDAKAGTYQPLFDDAGNLIVVAGIAVDQSYVVPAGVGAARFVKLWSQTAEVDVNQTADRVINVDVKSI